MQLYWATETEKDDASSIASSAGLEGLKPMSKDELIHERFMTKPNEAQLVSCLLFSICTIYCFLFCKSLRFLLNPKPSLL